MPAPTPPPDPPAAAASRLGLCLCAAYVLLYGGFIGLVLLRPDLLSRRPFGGVNLAIAYGMGLIGAAFLMALVYMLGRRDRPSAPRR